MAHSGFALHKCVRWIAAAIAPAVLLLLLAVPTVLLSEQPRLPATNEKSSDGKSTVDTSESQRAARLKEMHAIVAGIQLRSGEADNRVALELSTEPLLRYADPPHESLEDATVWVWRRGERPAAMLKLEFYPRLDRGPTWSFCWTSLSGAPMEGQVGGGPSWSSRAAQFAPQWLPDAPSPAEDADQRLRQMRGLARRFTAYRIYGEHGRTELRLLSRPVYRYKSESDGIIDGAIFSIVKDTNPHVELLIESAADGDSPRWRYACVRHADAECHLLLDGREVWHVEMQAAVDRRQPYFWFQTPAQVIPVKKAAAETREAK